MTPTGIELRVCEDIAARQAKGIEKYGTTLADNPASQFERLTHAYQEALDLAVYLKWEIERVQSIAALTELTADAQDMGLYDQSSANTEPEFDLLGDSDVIQPGDGYTRNKKRHWWKVDSFVGLTGKTVGQAKEILGRDFTVRRRCQPQYRPFASAEEFKPHASRLLTDGHGYYIAATFSGERLWLNMAYQGISWEELFRVFTFDDDGTPCGVRL